jgi:hypothetical protein
VVCLPFPVMGGKNGIVLPTLQAQKLVGGFNPSEKY